MVRDHEWVNLETYADHTKPYFYARCIGTDKKKTFKHKVFNLTVVIPHAQWTEFEALQEQLVDTTIAPPANDTGHNRSPSPELPTLLSPSPSPHPPSPALPTVARHNHSLPPHPASPEPSHPPMATARLFLSTPSAHNLQKSSLPGFKRPYERTGSSSSVTSRSPPSKRPVAITEASSPDQKAIKDALRSGGGAVLNVDRSEHVPLQVLYVC